VTVGLLPVAAGAQAYRVRDVNPIAEAAGSRARALGEHAGRAIVLAETADLGFEPYVSDGTAAGTVLLHDVCPGAGSSSASRFLTVAGITYFAADECGGRGRELWRTDGTPDGTWLVKDVHPGPAHSTIEFPTVAGGRLFFSADDGATGPELWQSDGTEAGTRRWADVAPGLRSSAPAWIAPTPDLGLVFFAAFDLAGGREIWAIATCADALVDPGEECDDGADNGGPASCCAAGCRFKPNGTASCDGNVCTVGDACVDGACTPGGCAEGAACSVCGGVCGSDGGACACEF
jgi:ELWxxDGT repeat protein